MKLSHLRAAAHNLADSISSEVSSLLGYSPFGLWEHIAQRADQRLQLDLLTGEVMSTGAPTELQDRLRDCARIVPNFLREQRCDPSVVSSIRVEFRRTEMVLPSRKEAVVSIELADGRTSVDRYVGDPLKRPRRLDSQGRIRPDLSQFGADTIA
jgi:hypothetical protein